MFFYLFFNYIFVFFYCYFFYFSCDFFKLNVIDYDVVGYVMVEEWVVCVKKYNEVVLDYYDFVLFFYE